MKNFREIQVDEQNMLNWQGLIVPVSMLMRKNVPTIAHCCSALLWIRIRLAARLPLTACLSLCPRAPLSPQDNPPYNKGAFRIEINFPAEYPFKPPKINFKTKIYHPNIDEKGRVCLPIILPDNWKPATKTNQGRRHCSLFAMPLAL